MSDKNAVAVREDNTPLNFGHGISPRHDINQGAVMIEQERAIAEAQGQLILAKKFPRDVHQCRVDFLEACASLDFAEEAFYSVPNRGNGPSIRFAEEIARCYGNFEYGHRELSRSPGKSEIEVFAWDKEKNNHSKRQITVFHVRDKTGGAVPLTDQTDIDNRIANVAAKQMRGRILALMPKALVAEGTAVAKRTLAGGGEKTVTQRVAAMVSAFGKFGVTVKQLEAYLSRDLTNVTVDDLADLAGVHSALKEGAKAIEYFAVSTTNEASSTLTAIADSAKTAEKKADAKPAAKAQPKETEKADAKAAPADAKPAAKAEAKDAAKPETKAEAKPAAAQAKAKAPEPEPEPEPEVEPEPEPEAGETSEVEVEEVAESEYAPADAEEDDDFF